MKLSTKIIIGIALAVMILGGLELLISSYFLDQFGSKP